MRTQKASIRLARWAVLPLVLVGLVVSLGALGCDSTPADDDEDEEEELNVEPIEDGGFEDIGSVVSNWRVDRPTGWFAPAGYDGSSDGGPECRDEGRCFVGGMIASFASLTPPQAPFPDGQGRFGFITTQNFIGFNEEPFDLVRVISSGMELDFDVPDQASIRLKFEYAFLTNNIDADVAGVYLVVNGSPVTVLEQTRSALEESDFVEGGCGVHDDDGFVPASYPVCTSWQTYSFDLTPYRGQEAQLRVIATEVGGDNGAPTTLAFDNFRVATVR
ncbi:MAG: hypothetical protein ACR2GR_04155 [Rhodothermales bacterium]